MTKAKCQPCFFSRLLEPTSGCFFASSIRVYSIRMASELVQVSFFSALALLFLTLSNIMADPFSWILELLYDCGHHASECSEAIGSCHGITWVCLPLIGFRHFLRVSISRRMQGEEQNLNITAKNYFLLVRVKISCRLSNRLASNESQAVTKFGIRDEASIFNARHSALSAHQRRVSNVVLTSFLRRSNPCGKKRG